MSGQLASRRVTGVTLIELLIAIAIVGVIAAIAVPIYTDYIDTAKQAAMQANVKSIAFLMESYERDEGSYPRDPASPADFLQCPAKCAELFAELRWSKSAADQASYTITNVTASGYTLTATHADGTVVTN
jgi:type IV pilus assembly protein PilE